MKFAWKLSECCVLSVCFFFVFCLFVFLFFCLFVFFSFCLFVFKSKKMSSSPAESGRRGKPNLQGIDRRGSATAAARSKISPILVFGFFPFEFKISGISASWERPITKRGEDRQWQRRLWPASTAKSHRLEHFSHLMKVKLLLFRRDKCDKKVLLSVNCDPNQEVFLDSWFVISLAFISDWHPGPRMSASDQMRAMLDQLMGTQRNGESWNPSSNVVLVIFNMITDEKNPSQCKSQRDNLPYCYVTGFIFTFRSYWTQQRAKREILFF